MTIPPMAPTDSSASSDCRPLRGSVSGWGRFPVGETDLYRPERLRSLTTTLRCSNSVLARGLGRSYGDACYNTAGATVLMERLNRFLSFDADTGILECDAGVTFLELLDHFVPRGFFPPVTPGTKFVTVGGALACDVHGKNHHVDGSFSNHVLDFDLLTASGDVLQCSRSKNSRVFWGTVGGLGLTGVITRIRLRLRPIETSYVTVDYERAGNLDDALDRLEARDDAFAYSVAWIDCLARGPSLGRSVLMRGNPARPEQLRKARVREAFEGRRPQRVRVPLDVPGVFLNRYTVRAFNALYYRRHPVEGRDRLVHFEPFFYPLDGIGDWNRLYGRRGFVQYQLLLPPDNARDGLVRALEVLSGSGAPSFLAVLKRFGAAEEASLLSFPRPGYTLALDLPWRGEPTEALLGKLDEMVLSRGGRVYLAKDARLGPEPVAAMYPELNAWREIKAEIDPEGLFSSDLARRVGLVR